MSVLTVFLRIILGSVFIYASLDKIADPAAFAGIIHNYQLFPDFMISPLALGLPWLEFVCGACLVTGVLPRASSFILTVLLASFMVALAYNGYRGLDVACGCFSTDAAVEESVMKLMVRDAIFIVMSVAVFVTSLKRNRASL